jgi:hypothetical protein
MSRSTAERDVLRPVLRCEYITEPKIEFAEGRQHVDPKLGILRYGPKSYRLSNRHPSSVRVGLIGTAQSVETARNWIAQTSSGVAGDEIHPEFPGCAGDRGYWTELQFDSQWIAQFGQSELRDLLGIRATRTRFEQVLETVSAKLDLLSKKDLPPQYVVLAIPTELYAACRTVQYKDKVLGKVQRDFRRAFKALAMKYRIPTQILRERTASGADPDHPSKIAWNFFNGLYFKAGGFPWGPVGLTPGTCYMGISFFRPLGSALHTMQTAMVQAFDEHGDGLVLRGPDFQWDAGKEGTASPHLGEDVAAELVTTALDRYEAEMGQTPTRLVVHKTSRYWEAEKKGFERAIRRRLQRYDLVALTPQSTARLMPVSNYPTLRGTRFSIGDLDYLYTTGFIAELGQFHAMHVPAPLLIADHVGSDSPREQLLREILILTKMNWNSARLGGLLPITLRFSKLVGNIMKEMSPDQEPLTNFKFYM